jgi:hypothetical protein
MPGLAPPPPPPGPPPPRGPPGPPPGPPRPPPPGRAPAPAPPGAPRPPGPAGPPAPGPKPRPPPGRGGMLLGLGRGPAGRGPPGRAESPGAPGPGRGPPGRGPAGRGPPGVLVVPGATAPGAGAAGAGVRGAAPMPVAVELNGLLPGRGPGRGPGRWPGAAGRGPAAAAGRSGAGRSAVGMVSAGGSCGPTLWSCGNGTVTAGVGLAGSAGAAGSALATGSAGTTSGATASAAAGAFSATSGADRPLALVLRLAPDLAGAAFAAPSPADGLAACCETNASLSLRTTGASIVEDADRTNSPISVSLAITALLSTPNSFASSYTRTFATALPYRPGYPDPQPAGAARAPSGVSLCCSSPHAHRALIAISAFFRPLNPRPRLPELQSRSPVLAAACRQVFRDLAIRQSSRKAKCSREGPAALGSFQACQASVQVRTPARQPRGNIGNDLVSRRDHADQLGSGRADSAPYTRPGR